MVRLNMIVEGQTEETFVRDILKPHLRTFDVQVRARIIETGRRGRKIFRGGLVSYEKLKLDLQNWMARDKGAWYTTMIDLYGLPRGFPGSAVLHKEDILQDYDPYELVTNIEYELERDISNDKFFAYVQLYEFESLLLTDPEKLTTYFFRKEAAIKKLKEEVSSFPTPEHVNNSPETAPSKRIIKYVPDYRYNKKSAGPIIAAEIGLTDIRRACKHFDGWLTAMENLAN